MDTQNTNIDNDPLAMPADAVDTSFPILTDKKAKYRMVIRGATIGESRSTPGNQTLTIPLYTTQEEKTRSGEPVNAGFPVRHYIGVTETPDRPAESIRRDVSAVLKAAGMGKVSTREVLNNPDVLNEKLVDVKIGIKPAKGEFPESNRVSSFIPA